MPTRRRTAAVVGVALSLATGAGVARAAWTSSQSTGPLTVATASLGAPAAAAVVVASCTRHSSYTLAFSWSAPSPATGVDGYLVLTSAASGGPYTTAAVVSGGSTTSAGVTYTSGWQSTLYVVVEATAAGWTSAASPEASVTTPHSANCK